MSVCAHTYMQIYAIICAHVFCDLQSHHERIYFFHLEMYLPRKIAFLILCNHPEVDGICNFQATNLPILGEFFDVSSCLQDGQVSESHSRQLEVSHGLDRAGKILGWDLEGL